MDDTTFWSIIETAGRKAKGDADRLAEGVRKELVKRSAADIEAFGRLLNEKMVAAYSWDCGGQGT